MPDLIVGMEEFLEKLSRRALIGIMWAALDDMQCYNGNSKIECIMRALGADERDKPGDPGVTQWRLPTVKKARLRGETQPLI